MILKYYILSQFQNYDNGDLVFIKNIFQAWHWNKMIFKYSILSPFKKHDNAL